MRPANSSECNPLSALTSLVFAALVASATSNEQHTQRAEPHAEEAVTAVTTALQRQPLVAIGEMHRNQQVHDLIATLIRDVRFLPNGGDIVVEFGNGRYQARMDRYIAGEAVDRQSLVEVWRNTVNILVWDAPVYERFFAVVRDVNRTRPVAKRLRVILADPEIDWSTTHDRRTWEQIAATRDGYADDVIEREVLAHGRHALLVFGSGHVQHEAAFGQLDKSGHRRSPNLAELLDRDHPGAAYYITADWLTVDMAARLVRWKPPVVFDLKGTWLGAAHVGPRSQTPKIGDIADALLYLGPPSALTTSTPVREMYADTAYLRELLRRDDIQGGANADELRELSAKFLTGRMR
jgi:hypothetical protein